MLQVVEIDTLIESIEGLAREADAEAIALIASEIAVQEARLVEANPKLASAKSTKKPN